MTRIVFPEFSPGTFRLIELSVQSLQEGVLRNMREFGKDVSASAAIISDAVAEDELADMDKVRKRIYSDNAAAVYGAMDVFRSLLAIRDIQSPDQRIKHWDVIAITQMRQLKDALDHVMSFTAYEPGTSEPEKAMEFPGADDMRRQFRQMLNSGTVREDFENAQRQLNDALSSPLARVARRVGERAGREWSL